MSSVVIHNRVKPVEFEHMPVGTFGIVRLTKTDTNCIVYRDTEKTWRFIGIPDENPLVGAEKPALYAPHVLQVLTPGDSFEVRV